MDFQDESQVSIAMQVEQEETDQLSRMQVLSDQIFDLKEELKQEYLEMFRTDPDTQEALTDLDEYGTLKYNYKGLVKTLPMEFNDFDDVAESAFLEFAEANGFEVDFTLNTIYKIVDSYLMYVGWNSEASLVLYKGNERQDIPISRKVRTAEQIKELLTDTALEYSFDGMKVSSDEYGNVTVVE